MESDFKKFEKGGKTSRYLIRGQQELYNKILLLDGNLYINWKKEEVLGKIEGRISGASNPVTNVLAHGYFLKGDKKGLWLSHHFIEKGLAERLNLEVPSKLVSHLEFDESKKPKLFYEGKLGLLKEGSIKYSESKETFSEKVGEENFTPIGEYSFELIRPR